MQSTIITCDKCGAVLDNKGIRVDHFKWSADGDPDNKRKHKILDLCRNCKQEWKDRQKTKDEEMDAWIAGV